MVKIKIYNRKIYTETMPLNIVNHRAKNKLKTKIKKEGNKPNLKLRSKWFNQRVLSYI